MNLSKRIKKIVSLTVEDWYNQGYSTDETPKELREWINKALLTYEDLEDRSTIEISLQVLKLLNSLDIVDLEYIHNVIFKDVEQTKISISLQGVEL